MKHHDKGNYKLGNHSRNQQTYQTRERKQNKGCVLQCEDQMEQNTSLELMVESLEDEARQVHKIRAAASLQHAKGSAEPNHLDFKSVSESGLFATSESVLDQALLMRYQGSYCSSCSSKIFQHKKLVLGEELREIQMQLCEQKMELESFKEFVKDYIQASSRHITQIFLSNVSQLVELASKRGEEKSRQTQPANWSKNEWLETFQKGDEEIKKDMKKLVERIQILKLDRTNKLNNSQKLKPPPSLEEKRPPLLSRQSLDSERQPTKPPRLWAGSSLESDESGTPATSMAELTRKMCSLQRMYMGERQKE